MVCFCAYPPTPPASFLPVLRNVFRPHFPKKAEGREREGGRWGQIDAAKYPMEKLDKAVNREFLLWEMPEGVQLKIDLIKSNWKNIIATCKSERNHVY